MRAFVLALAGVLVLLAGSSGVRAEDEPVSAEQAALEIGVLQEAGCATTDEDGLGRDLLTPRLGLLQQGGHVRGALVITTGVGVEVAIGTLARAEGQMRVDVFELRARGCCSERGPRLHAVICPKVGSAARRRACRATAESPGARVDAHALATSRWCARSRAMSWGARRGRARRDARLAGRRRRRLSRRAGRGIGSYSPRRSS